MLRWRMTALAGLMVLCAMSTRAARAGEAEAAAATAPRPGPEVRPDGSLVLGPVVARLAHYDANWKFHDATEKRLDAAWNETAGTLEANFAVSADHSFRLSQTRAAGADGAVRFDYRLEAPAPVPTKLLALVFFLPADMAGQKVRLDHLNIALPEKKDKAVLAKRKTKHILFRAGDRDVFIGGEVQVELRDQRRDGKGHFQLRLLFAPEGQAVEKAELSFNLSWPGVWPGAPKLFAYPNDDRYAPLDPLPTLAVEPGSALDLSFLLDAPAGKHGRVVVDEDGRFVFAGRPGERVRFYGANLCHDTQFLEKADADRLAAELSRIGYNAIRLHHFDGLLTRAGPDSATPDPEKMERLDYLFHVLKKAGLYIAIDLYSTRSLRPGDIPEMGDSNSRRALKHAVLLYPSARDNWKRYARNLLDHVNPHTGLRWADDPALVMASLLNEDPAFNRWDGHPVIKAEFEKQFAEWRAARDLPPASPNEDKPAMARFLVERQIEVYNEFRRFLREDLGTELLAGGVNYKNAEAQSFIRETLDYVDNHSYFNHPHFLPGKAYAMPVKFNPGNPVRGGFGTIRDLAHSRIFGKPFTITETNFVYPNPYRAAGGVILGAFGGLQDYDAIFRFAYSHHAKKLFDVVPISYYDVASDPINLLAERAAALLFLRADARPFPERRVWLYDESAYRAFHDFGKEGGRFPYDFGWLANSARIGCLNRAEWDAFDKTRALAFVSRHAEPAPDAPRWNGGEFRRVREADRLELEKEGGQWRANSDEGRFELVTKRSEAFFLPEGGAGEGIFLGVENREGTGLFFVASLDDEPLADTKRALLLHLTDVQNTGIRFDDEACTMLRRWGTLPLRLGWGAAELSLPEGFEVRALEPTGAVRAVLAPLPAPPEEPSAPDAGRRARYRLDTREHAAMAYEIVRK